MLKLNRESAVAALARAVKIGMDVHAGKVGPREFYPTEEKYLEALLRSRLTRRP